MALPRPILCLAAVLLASGSAEGKVRIGLNADFPPGSPREIRVEAIAAGGDSIASWGLIADGATIDVDPPLEAKSLRVSSPIHDPCMVVVPAHDELTCTLRPLVRFYPFGASSGRIWVRGEGETAFKRLDPVPADWGSGFALRDGRYDLVIAPKGRRARLLPGTSPMEAGVDTAEPAEVATELRARFVDAAGRPLREAPKIDVEVRPGLTGPAALRLEAWRSFFASIEVSVRSGLLRIEPLPVDVVSFVAAVPGRGRIRFSASRPTGGPVLDLGEIRFPSAGSIRAMVEVSEDVAQRLPGPVLLRPQLRQGLPGFDPPTAPSPEWRAWTAPALVFGELFAGEWDFFARSGDLALGYTTVYVAEGGEQEVVLRIGEILVAGQVVDGAGEGAPAQVAIMPAKRMEGVKPLVVQTDEEGRFDGTLPWIGGVLRLSAFASESTMPADVEVDPDREQTTALRLKLPGATVEVVCVDDRSGKAIPKALLDDLVLSSSTAGTHFPNSREADDDGRVRLTRLHGGRLKFIVSAPGYAKAEAEVEVPEDRSVKHEVRLRKEGRLEGTVVGSTGQPIPGATVTGPLIGASVDLSRNTTTGSDGRFVLDVPGGSVILAAWATGYRLSFATVSTEAGDARLMLEQRGPDSLIELRGRGGEPPPTGSWPAIWYGATRVPSIVVEEAFAAGGCRFPATRRDGTVMLGGCLAAGRYGLGLTTLGGSEIPPGELTVPGPPITRVELPWVPK